MTRQEFTQLLRANGAVCFEQDAQKDWPNIYVQHIWRGWLHWESEPGRVKYGPRGEGRGLSLGGLLNAHLSLLHGHRIIPIADTTRIELRDLQFYEVETFDLGSTSFATRFFNRLILDDSNRTKSGL